MSTCTYNRSAAVAYARLFSSNYKGTENYNNTGFEVLEKDGTIEDCANFISQCMYSGNMPMDLSGNGWFYRTPYAGLSSRAGNWVGASSLLNFLKTKGRGTVYVSSQGLKEGDLVFSKASSSTTTSMTHVTIVSQDVKSDGKVYVCGHTANQKDRPNGSTYPLYFHLYDTITLDADDRLYYGYRDERDFVTATAGYGEATLRKGDANEYVVNLKNRLSYLDFFHGVVNQDFDDACETAVIDFQNFYRDNVKKIDVDGVVGFDTKSALYHPALV